MYHWPQIVSAKTRDFRVMFTFRHRSGFNREISSGFFFYCSFSLIKFSDRTIPGFPTVTFINSFLHCTITNDFSLIPFKAITIRTCLYVSMQKFLCRSIMSMKKNKSPPEMLGNQMNEFSSTWVNLKISLVTVYVYRQMYWVRIWTSDLVAISHPHCFPLMEWKITSSLGAEFVGWIICL